MYDKSKNITKIIEAKNSNFINLEKEILKDFGFNFSKAHPDKMTIAPEENDSIGIKKLSDLKKWIYTKPYSSKYKILVIKNAEQMTIQAQNSILKVIEEPPIYAHIYLIIENSNVLLDTIISRSELIQMKDDSKDDDEISDFIKSNLIERLDIADKISKKNKKYIQDFLNKLLNHYKKQSTETDLINDILNSQKYLISNVPKKNILENLILKIDSEHTRT